MYEYIYSSPEKFGLTVVDEIDYSSGSYEFDIRIVWKHESGKFYTMRDSGCSCPVPFEDYHSIEALDILDIEELRRETREELSSQYNVYVTPDECQEFIRTIENAVKGV